jgi:hypothetical protein
MKMVGPTIVLRRVATTKKGEQSVLMKEAIVSYFMERSYSRI